MNIRKFKPCDIKFIIEIWNDIINDGIAFPQTEILDEISGGEFFATQSFTGVCVSKTGEILGLYILHPNNVGRCAHIANASYAVSKNARGKGVGESLVRDSLKQAKNLGFRIMQFNAVVADNTIALRLYEKLGFIRLGVIKGGFLLKNGTYANIIPHYIELDKFK